MTENEKHQIIELKNKGFGYKKIAKELELNTSTVAKFIQKTERELNVSKCPTCGKTFTYTRGHRKRKYCCEECRREYWRLHGENRTLHTYKCEHCGRLFRSEKISRKYCSKECYLAERYGHE